MTILLKLNPSTQLVERATSSARTRCDGSLGPAREGSFRFLTRPLRWKRDRSLASTPDSAELISATFASITKTARTSQAGSNPSKRHLADRGIIVPSDQETHASSEAGGPEISKTALLKSSPLAACSQQSRPGRDERCSMCGQRNNGNESQR
jgi:hypothetical protein